MNYHVFLDVRILLRVQRIYFPVQIDARAFGVEEFARCEQPEVLLQNLQGVFQIFEQYIERSQRCCGWFGVHEITDQRNARISTCSVVGTVDESMEGTLHISSFYWKNRKTNRYSNT